MAKVLFESNCQALGITLIIEESGPEGQQNSIKTHEQKIYAKYKGSTWYKNIIHYLLFLRCPLGWIHPNTEAWDCKRKNISYPMAYSIGRTQWRYCYYVWWKERPIKWLESFMKEFVEGITTGRPWHTKSSRLDSTGLRYLGMFIPESRCARNAKCLRKDRSFHLSPWFLCMWRILLDSGGWNS